MEFSDDTKDKIKGFYEKLDNLSKDPYIKNTVRKDIDTLLAKTQFSYPQARAIRDSNEERDEEYAFVPDALLDPVFKNTNFMLASARNDDIGGEIAPLVLTDIASIKTMFEDADSNLNTLLSHHRNTEEGEKIFSVFSNLREIVDTADDIVKQGCTDLGMSPDDLNITYEGYTGRMKRLPENFWELTNAPEPPELM